MIAKFCTIQDLERALEEVNKLYDNNIEFNHIPEMKGRQVVFTLRVKDSKGKGHFYSNSGRRLISACYHVHGNFFEELFKLKPEANILSMAIKITKDNVWDNDFKVGGLYDYQWASELCDCT